MMGNPIELARAWRRERNVSEAAKACLCNPDGSLSQSGKVLMSEIRRFCYIDRTCQAFTKDGATDVPATMVAEGRRQACYRVLELVSLDTQAIQHLTGESDE